MRHFAKTIVLSVALAAPATALAAGGYVGLGIGQSTFDVVHTVCDGITAIRRPGTTANCETEDSDTSVSLFAGYDVTEYFAAEIGYLELGEASANTRLISGGIGGRIDSTVEASGIYLAAVGKLPLGDRATVLIKAGVIDLDLEGRIEASIADLPLGNDSIAASGTEAIYGLGVDFNATERLAVRLQYERIDLDEAIDNVSLALIGRF